MQLERERKLLTDAIKMIAYRAESYMAGWVEPFFARHEDEARKFLQTIFQATADLLPDPKHNTLTVRFHGLSSPRATRAWPTCVTSSRPRRSAIREPTFGSTSRPQNATRISAPMSGALHWRTPQ